MSGITDTPILILCIFYIEHYTHRYLLSLNINNGIQAAVKN
jgi:hypothetical protein